MKHSDQLQHFDEFFGKLKETLIKKGGDYANTDCLSNFKLAGSICGLTAEQNCLSLIATKVARLGVLLASGDSPNNESIEDSILDLNGYAFLLSCIRKDTQVEVGRKTMIDKQLTP